VDWTTVSDAVILGYHRVSVMPHVDVLGRGLEVAASRFQRHLELLARRFSIVPLEDLVVRLMTGADAGATAAVTFDDGYEDNYTCAFPILSQMGVPATVFLTTDNIEHARPFWTERLAAYLCRSAGAVVTLPNEAGGARLDLTSAERIRRSYKRLRAELSGQDGDRRERVLDLLETPNATMGRPLTWEQIRTMSRHGVAFGAHTGSHPSLPRLSDARVRAEVEASRDLIRVRLGVAPTTFAYPFGDVDDRVSRIVEATGFLGAVTTRNGWCTPGARRLLLPRLMVGDWPAQGFVRFLLLARVEARVSPA
jgi:peptidoglycan/xylan/chitin deacetylase (PgdA/CDA1 family)